MHRLFVAIRPPRQIREQLLATMGGVHGARWQSDDQLHLTLRFIGAVDRHLAEDIHAVLGTIHHAAFEIALAGAGCFEQRGRPDTLWAGVSPHEPLKTLHKKVDQALTRIGVAPDRRTYLPHITLARMARTGAGPIDGFIAEAMALASQAFAVDSFCLFESDLAAGGAIYSIVERYDLGSAV